MGSQDMLGSLGVPTSEDLSDQGDANASDPRDLVKLALEGRFDVIVHGCNCQCTMGAGIAKTIKQVFPEAYKADLATAKGNRTKLGSLSAVTVERSGRRLTIVNR